MVRVAPDAVRAGSPPAALGYVYFGSASASAPAPAAPAYVYAESAAASALAEAGPQPAAGAPARLAAPPAQAALQQAQTLRDAGLEALNPETFPRVAWRSEEWNNARAERSAALRAWYGTYSAAECRAALAQALEIRGFPAKSQGEEAHAQARAVRLIQMEVLLELMPAEARAQDLAFARSEAALPGTGCRMLEFEKRYELRRLHLMAHHEHLTAAERRASWAEATDLVRLSAPVSKSGGQRRWEGRRKLAVEVAYDYLPEEDRAGVHWRLLDPTHFVELAWGSARSMTTYHRHYWSWTKLVEYLPRQVRFDMLAGAMATPTPTCGVAATDEQVRSVRFTQLASLLQRIRMPLEPGARERLRHWNSLPPFAPGQDHWDFAAAFRAYAMRSIFSSLPPEDRLAEWAIHLGALQLPPGPQGAAARPNAMRQRLDQVAILARNSGVSPEGAPAEEFWAVTTDPSTLPSRDTDPQGWRDALAIRAFAREQLRRHLQPALRATILARAGDGELPSPVAFAADAPLFGDDQRVLDLLGAIVMTEDPEATPSVSQRLLGGAYGRHFGAGVVMVNPRHPAGVAIGRAEDWRVPEVGSKLPEVD